MYESNHRYAKDINQSTAIYKLNLSNGKKYVGKTTDIDRRMDQHFSGNGSKVTKKFKPKEGKVVDEVPGYFADDVEQEYTGEYIDKYGYENVRGGKYTNSKTLHKGNSFNRPGKCYRCGRAGHSKSSCYAGTHAKGYSLDSEQGSSDDY